MQINWILLVLFQIVPKSYSKSNILPFFFYLDVCKSKSCYKDAQHMLSSMNTSVDPCVDFYEYACGGWLSKNNKPNSEVTWSQWEITTVKIEEQIQKIMEVNVKSEINALNSARKMYQTCKNFNNSEPENVLNLLKLLEEFGGWPIITKNWTNNEFWLTKTTNINAKLNIHPLLNFHVSINLYNTSENILYIDHPNFAFPQWILSNPSSYKHQLSEYVQWIINTVLEIAKISKMNVTYHDVKHQVHEIVKFEIQVASLINKDESNITRLFRKMSINQFQLWTDLISSRTNEMVLWNDVINTLLSNYNLKINTDDDIIVKDILYLLELLKLIEKTSPKIVANYLGWTIVKYFSKDLTKNIQNYAFKTDQLLYGIGERFSRKHECAIEITKQMNLPINYEYIKEYISDAKKKNIEIMLKNIKSILLTTINSLNWMDNQTKSRALDKAKAISYLVAYSNNIKNVTYIDEYYKELKITDNHIINLINWNKFSRQKEFLQLQPTISNNKNFNSVTDVNAYYSVLQNLIIVPAGLLQFSFYKYKRLPALNYGAIGTILAHEFSHAFDNTGRQADKNGNIKQWWSKKALSTYTKNVECFQEHYNKYITEMLQKLSHTTINITGYKNQDENIADILGLKISYEAYKLIKKTEKNVVLPQMEKFTTDQLFFISFANQWCEISNSEYLLNEIMDGEHIPNKIRVLGALSNSEEFQEAFKCEVNSPMNPLKKCKLW